MTVYIQAVMEHVQPDMIYSTHRPGWALLIQCGDWLVVVATAAAAAILLDICVQFTSQPKRSLRSSDGRERFAGGSWGVFYTLPRGLILQLSSRRLPFLITPPPMAHRVQRC